MNRSEIGVRPTLSVLLPVRNEAPFIAACLASTLAGLDHTGIVAELLVIDGDSSDGTGAIVSRVAEGDSRVHLLHNPGKTAPIALNLGIQHARGLIVIRIDGHAVYPTDYFAACLQVLAATGADNVGGYFETRSHGAGAMATAIAATTALPIGVGAGFRTGVPSGHADTVPYGCYRRAAFDRFGFFDERLIRGQDYEFNRRLVRLGGTIWRDESIRIQYFQIERLGKLLGKQLRLQGPGVAAMWCLAPWSFTLRHAAPLLLVVGTLGLLMLGIAFPLAWGALALGVLAYLAAVMVSAVRVAPVIGAGAAALVPLVVPLYHFAYGLGIFAGLLLMPVRLLRWQAWRRPWRGATAFRALDAVDHS